MADSPPLGLEDGKRNTESEDLPQTVNVLSWNVEGLKKILKNQECLTNFKTFLILQFVETLSMNNSSISIEGFKGFHVDARKNKRGGRPYGGVSVYLNSTFFKVESKQETQKSLHLKTNLGHIFTYYFNTYDPIWSICECLVAKLFNLSGQILVYGDFNCRLDQNKPEKCRRGEFLKRTMSLLEFRLLTASDSITYQHKGKKSCIDLVFVKNIPEKTELSIKAHKGKKHRKVLTTWPRETSTKEENTYYTNFLNGVFETKFQKESFKGTSWDEIERSFKIFEECKQKESSQQGSSQCNSTNFRTERPVQLVFKVGEDPWTIRTRIHKKLNDSDICHLNSALKNMLLNPARSLKLSEDTPETCCGIEIITADELKFALESTLKGKIKPIDGLTKSLLNSTFSDLQTWWTRVFNKVLKSGVILERWKKRTLVMAYKGREEHNKLSSYDLIPYVPLDLNMFEHIINKRIKEKTNTTFNWPLHSNSTKQGCSYLLNNIQKLVSNRDSNLYFAFRIETDLYDHLDREILLEHMQKHGITGYLYNTVRSLLCSNQITVVSGPKQFTTHCQNRGLPGGSPLNDTLYAIYYKALLDELQAITKVFIYKNEVFLFGESSDEVNKGLRTLEDWCKTNNVKIELNRIKRIKFSRGGSSKTPDENTNDYSRYLDILGYRFTPRLTLEPHICERLVVCAQHIGAMKVAPSLNVTEAKKFYQSKIWKFFTYGLKGMVHRIEDKHKYLDDADWLKAQLFRRLFGLGKKFENNLVFHIFGITTMGEDFLNAYPSTQAVSYRESVSKAKLQLTNETTAAFETNKTTAAFENVPKLARVHQCICEKQNGQHLVDGCICKYCKSTVKILGHVYECEDARKLLFQLYPTLVNQ